MTIQPGSSLELKTVIVPGSDPLQVWAVIRPPAPPVITGIPVSATDSLMRVNLAQNENDPQIWTAMLDNLKEKGIYLVSYIAQFPHNRLSRAEITRFRVSDEPNPEETLTIRALLTVGGGVQRQFAQNMVDYAHEVCQKRGYEVGSIRVLGHDYPTTGELFKEVLIELATPESTEEKLRLFLYLVGDCTPDGAFSFGEGESVHASNLLTFLDELQMLYPLLEIMLVVEAPYAGVFVEANVDTPSDHRVVITSTTATEKNVYTSSRVNISFSHYFLRNTLQGRDVYSSYVGAYYLLVDHMKAPEPWLDDNGDGQMSKEDKKLARNWYLGRRGVLAGSDAISLPTLLETSSFDESKDGNIEVWVDVLDAAIPKRVWVTIIPRGEGSDENVLFTEIDLVRDEDTWRWSGTISESSFNAPGEYTLLFYGLYGGGQLSVPVMTSLTFLEGNDISNWSLF